MQAGVAIIHRWFSSFRLARPMCWLNIVKFGTGGSPTPCQISHLAISGPKHQTSWILRTYSPLSGEFIARYSWNVQLLCAYGANVLNLVGYHVHKWGSYKQKSATGHFPLNFRGLLAQKLWVESEKVGVQRWDGVLNVQSTFGGDRWTYDGRRRKRKPKLFCFFSYIMLLLLSRCRREVLPFYNYKV